MIGVGFTGVPITRDVVAITAMSADTPSPHPLIRILKDLRDVSQIGVALKRAPIRRCLSTSPIKRIFGFERTSPFREASWEALLEAKNLHTPGDFPRRKRSSRIPVLILKSEL
jgi:hypothetical protein